MTVTRNLSEYVNCARISIFLADLGEIRYRRYPFNAVEQLQAL